MDGLLRADWTRRARERLPGEGRELDSHVFPKVKHRAPLSFLGELQLFTSRYVPETTHVQNILGSK